MVEFSSLRQHGSASSPQVRYRVTVVPRSKMKNKDRKKELVSKLAGEIKKAASLVVIDYSGMKVKAQQDLKRRLKEAGAQMLVVKNTLLKLALDEAQINEGNLSREALQGQTALIISKEDAISPINILGKFMKEFEIPQFKIGVVEGTPQDKDSLIRLSLLPGREALYGQVLGTIAAPAYGLLGTLEAKLQELVFILNAKAGGDTNG